MPGVEPHQLNFSDYRSELSVTRNGLCLNVLLNTLDTPVSIQRERKLGYALPMRTDYEEMPNLKKRRKKDGPIHVNKDLVFRKHVCHVNRWKKLKLPLRKTESSEFNEVAKIDHRMILKTYIGCNEFLVMIDRFTKYAEAVPCITTSPERLSII